jgi:hypothetical protein
VVLMRSGLQLLLLLPIFRLRNGSCAVVGSMVIGL